MTETSYDEFDPTEEFDEGIEDQDEGTSLAMFDGDTSQLYPEQRRCLHTLLRHGYISADSHPEHWATLAKNEGLITSRLNELFLVLHIDRENRRVQATGCE